MSKFIEALIDGLTIQGRVVRAGQRVQVRDSFPMASKKVQAQRWGAPRYRQVTREDFENVGGEVKQDDPSPDGGLTTAKAEAESPEAPAESPEVTETTETTEDRFAAFEELNVEDTLQMASELSEEGLTAFIAWEQAGQARKGVLTPLGVAETE